VANRLARFTNGRSTGVQLTMAAAVFGLIVGIPLLLLGNDWPRVLVGFAVGAAIALGLGAYPWFALRR
jgi:hypothetical protein